MFNFNLKFLWEASDLNLGETKNIAGRREVITNKFIKKARELYKDIVPPRFITSQSVIDVLDRREKTGAVTGRLDISVIIHGYLN